MCLISEVQVSFPYFFGNRRDNGRFMRIDICEAIQLCVKGLGFSSNPDSFTFVTLLCAQLTTLLSSGFYAQAIIPVLYKDARTQVWISDSVLLLIDLTV